jgi:NAD-dependent dihydropyrimidine dehydrogenase PreA subunit
MKHRYLKNVTTLRLDADKCIGCGRCTEVCPHQVLEMQNKRCTIKARDLCMECGACVKNCPTGALEAKPGVGCAYAIIKGWITGNEPSCGCSNDNSGGCC